MIEELTVTLPAPSGMQERNAYVYCPDFDGRFPVLYLFDGQTAFWDDRAPYGASLRLGELLNRMNAPLIVATVECDRRDRLSEYSPFVFASRFGRSTGQGKQFMDWLTGTFKQQIDGTYPTRSDRAHTYLMGSSMGGLMSLFGLARYPHIFSRAAALSPSLWTDPVGCEELLDALPADARLWLDYGEVELRQHGKNQARALRMAEEKLAGRAGCEFHIIEGGRHDEASWRARLPQVLAFLDITANAP